jgi:hypothetical protein
MNDGHQNFLLSIILLRVDDLPSLVINKCCPFSTKQNHPTTTRRRGRRTRGSTMVRDYVADIDDDDIDGQLISLERERGGAYNLLRWIAFAALVTSIVLFVVGLTKGGDWRSAELWETSFAIYLGMLFLCASCCCCCCEQCNEDEERNTPEPFPVAVHPRDYLHVPNDVYFYYQNNPNSAYSHIGQDQDEFTYNNSTLSLSNEPIPPSAPPSYEYDEYIPPLTHSMPDECSEDMKCM